MGKSITGNSYRYIIDESYGINKDGFIAVGTESIVYKGLKVMFSGGMKFACVLKFKPKTMITDGRKVDCLEKFRTEEWKIFEELRECRSVVRIDDVVGDLGDFSLICPHIDSGVIDASSYFCVIEEFIDGWNLDEYCREECWKLRRYEPVDNGLKKEVEYYAFSKAEQATVAASYNYDNQLKYQNQILLFMINLCEIMEFVTEQKNILHLDIKPENIMVTRYGKELVLIDFGRSRRVTVADRFTDSGLSPADYNREETQEKQYEYGALGYAAPECFCAAAEGSRFPFSFSGRPGHMSLESDIFSFGATFWECLNMFELITKSGNSKFDFYDFYRDNFLNDDAYCNRDLSLTTLTYHQKLEKIIKKCTREREEDFTVSERYYHSYKDLRKDIELAKDSAPTIVKEENVKVRTAFHLCGVMAALAVVFLIINSIYHLQAYQIAGNKWDNLTESYNETQFSKLSEIARDYVAFASAGRIDDTYDKIVKFTYRNHGSISDYEAAMLVDILSKMRNYERLPERVDEIMLHADTGSFRAISSEIVRLDVTDESIGYELATAIYNVEVSKTGVPEAYDTLVKYENNTDFRNGIIKLKNVLDNDDNIALIMEHSGQTRQEVLAFFNGIMKQRSGYE